MTRFRRPPRPDLVLALASALAGLLSGCGTMQPAADAPSLESTAWRITGINNGKQAVVSVLAGTSPTLAFAADGRASGSAGCNSFNSRYTAEGAQLKFAPPASTRKMCAEPEGVMEQEQMFLAALETVATAQVEGDRLELRRADGALALSATRDGGG